MTSIAYTALALAIGAAIAGSAPSALAYTGQNMAKDAKITIEQARATALRTVPGKIIDEELEKEAGGSGLRYSFDVTLHGVTHEVGVDAKTGTLLENSLEGRHPD